MAPTCELPRVRPQALGIVALGPDNVWAEFGVGVGNPTDALPVVVAHLTAHGWSVLRPPSSLSVTVDYLDNAMGGNAKAGIWLAAVQARKPYARVFAHVAGSTWKLAAEPNDLLVGSVSAIPGSGDLLALGIRLPDTTPLPAGVLLGYGI